MDLLRGIRLQTTLRRGQRVAMCANFREVSILLSFSTVAWLVWECARWCVVNGVFSPIDGGPIEVKHAAGH